MDWRLRTLQESSRPSAAAWDCQSVMLGEMRFLASLAAVGLPIWYRVDQPDQFLFVICLFCPALVENADHYGA